MKPPEQLKQQILKEKRLTARLQMAASRVEAAVQQQLADEGEVLRWCIEWLEQLSRGEPVVVNLRPALDAGTAFLSFDRARVVQVLKRIAAELDRLSGRRTPSETLDATGNSIAAGVKHRQRLAEPEPQLASLSQRNELF